MNQIEDNLHIIELEATCISFHNQTILYNFEMKKSFCIFLYMKLPIFKFNPIVNDLLLDALLHSSAQKDKL